MRHVVVKNQTRDGAVGDRVEVANTSISRMVGLLGRKGVDAGGGLWIKPSSGVHTIGMSFAIDVIGLDKNHRVIKLWENLVPYRITSVSLAMRSVIELAAGDIAKKGVQLGDVLSMEDV